MRRVSFSPFVGAAVVAVTVSTVTAQQPGVSLSPFVTFLPDPGASPLVGLSIGIAGGPLALRAGGHLSLEERGAMASSAVATRPWGADADALIHLESYTSGERVVFTPYVFVGVSAGAIDSGAFNIVRQGWSYGGGATIPIGGGGALHAFGELRWRMSQFVMPNSESARPATREARLGLSFRVGGGGSAGEIVHALSSADLGSVLEESGVTSRAASRLLSTADGYVGTPYRRGGTSPSSGFDAAGFVRFVFSMLGVNLPRWSRDQARVGERLPADWRSLQPGDLMMFEDGGGINHVAIYVGRSRIIHSSETGGGVRYDDLNTDRGQWFLEHLAAARRVIPDARGLLMDLARGFPSDVSNRADVPDHAPRIPAKRRN